MPGLRVVGEPVDEEDGEAVARAALEIRDLELSRPHAAARRHPISPAK
jgi:hypothetical protein